MKELVQRILAGERDAYRDVVREYGPVVRACLASHLSSAQTVEDLAQETFIAAYEHLKEFDLQRDFGPWIKTIARNKALSHLRRVQLHGAALEKLKAQAAERMFEEIAGSDEAAGSLDRLRSCLEKLPRRVMDILRARYFDRQPVNGIAAKQKTSIGAVSSLLFRARKDLQGCMERGR
jgi:RNA polymerase sigma-70 factor, ECF subfamily